MADGQVTRGNEIVKPNVTKVRRLNDKVISGFAGMGCVLGASCSACLLALDITQNETHLPMQGLQQMPSLCTIGWKHSLSSIQVRQARRPWFAC